MARRKTTRSPDSSADRVSQYAAAVCSGEIIAGPHVRHTCERHFRDLESGHERGLYFDHDAAERVYEFFEKILRLNGGQFEGLPFVLDKPRQDILSTSAELTGSDVTLSLPLRCVDKFEEP